MRVWAIVVVTPPLLGCGVILGAEWDGTLAAPDEGSSSTGDPPACDACSGAVVTAVAAGDEHTCAVIDGGVKCWGQNALGELGNGSDTMVASPVPVDVVTLDSGVERLAAHFWHTCAIANGKVACWGLNTYGQLGSMTATDTVPAPVTVLGLDGPAGSVTVGWGHSCATVEDSLWCWGNNEYGQIGNGSTGNTPVAPTKVIDGGVTQASAALTHTCAVVHGAVQCWGGINGTFQSMPTPTPVDGLTDAIAVAAAPTYTCALAGGGAWCWGSSEEGALGHPGATFLIEPNGLAGIPADASHLGANELHACAIASGGVFCWGAYPGDGTSSSDAPVAVTLDSPPSISAIGVGKDHACAVKDGSLYCWGSNSKGKLGVPTSATPEALTPLRVPL